MFQIYKLEVEQQRLEEDAFVYNWLQQQLKLSPAYKKVVLILFFYIMFCPSSGKLFLVPLGVAYRSLLRRLLIVNEVCLPPYTALFTEHHLKCLYFFTKVTFSFHAEKFIFFS